MISAAKADNNFVIVYIHWGTEGTDKLDHWQQEQAPQIAAAGADLIIGDHPHVLQPIGYQGDVPVVYSLGNYLFNSKTLDSCLVEAVIEMRGWNPAVYSGEAVELPRGEGGRSGEGADHQLHEKHLSGGGDR